MIVAVAQCHSFRLYSLLGCQADRCQQDTANSLGRNRLKSDRVLVLVLVVTPTYGRQSGR